MESDFNEITDEQLKESVERMKTYEELLKAATSRQKYKQLPEYSILEELLTIEAAEKIEDVELVFVVESNKEKRVNEIIAKMNSLQRRFPLIRLGLLHFYTDKGTLCYSQCKFFAPTSSISELVNLSWSYTDYKAVTVNFDDLITNISYIDWQRKLKNVFVILNQGIVTKNPIKPQLEFFNHVFVTSTALYNGSEQQSLDQLVLLSKKCSHIFYSRVNLFSPFITNGIWFNQLLPIELNALTMEDKIAALRQLEQNPNFDDVQRLKGVVVTVPTNYTSGDSCLYTFGVSPTLSTKQSVIEINPQIEHHGAFKVMMKGIIDGENVAVKYDHDLVNNTFDNYVGILEGYSVTQKLLDEFNTMNERQVKCVDCKLFIADITLPDGIYPVSHLRHLAEGKMLFLVETLLTDSFIKWNSNNGDVNFTNYSATLNCFSHYSFIRSAKRLLVADIQGCLHNDVYLITDMAIHHEMLCRFGASGDNSRGVGMVHFLKTHVCNQSCIKLGLDKVFICDKDEEMVTQAVLPVITVK
ncbi:elongation factor 2 kinase, putative [Entamoeba invadens IP1]|uniref:elongation factor 2 kinase, putative n=1 Tax=Entamoeba invadens IP1 TaxID=370355 RepID=UPI0002C3D866|nr:elongation factor 2 kinase, putative [Entamoeba invadens IP1]ELP93101.1 elongation factor 2 kinase, putative [Entamoeba invadens IP1]|eukprot:XP_004259872.1 elongation factor 2 kinase, putative [Entamoeba invadens IP1]